MRSWLPYTALAGALAAPLALVLLVVMLAPAGGPTAVPAGAVGGMLRPGVAVPTQYQKWINEAGSLCPEVTPALIAAQLNQESGFNPSAVSPAGAQGIAQFEPGTWASPGVAFDADGGGASVWDPADAIVSEGHYMCGLAANLRADLAAGRVHGDLTALTLAAYNCGQGCVENAGGIPAIGETTNYVTRITAVAAGYAAPAVLPAGASFGARIVTAAQSQLGVAYSWGGGSVFGPSAGTDGTVGFDCSGLVLYAVYQASGGTITLPHYTGAAMTASQSTAGQAVPESQIQPGDLLFFNTSDGPLGHVAIALGNGQMIHSPATGQAVQTTDWATNAYWSAAFGGARRLTPTPQP